MFGRQKYGCWSMEIQTIENATNHSLSNEWPRWQLCGGIASACRGRYCQADGQADPQQVPQRPGLAFYQLAQVLVDLPRVGLPLGANCHWTVHSGHLARGLGAL